MNFNNLLQQKVLGIIRGDIYDVISPLFSSIYESGLKSIEITMNSPRAAECIKKAADEFGDKLWIGAGTVLSLKDMHDALDAGAKFIVMPTLVEDVCKYCVENNIPVFPGAFTPQEIFNAHELGASMVKVFPAKFFGPDYIKEIKGPLNKIKLLACGGVNPKNKNDFFSCGASAVAFGGSVFKKELLEKRDFEAIKNSIKEFL